MVESVAYCPRPIHSEPTVVRMAPAKAAHGEFSHFRRANWRRRLAASVRRVPILASAFLALFLLQTFQGSLLYAAPVGTTSLILEGDYIRTGVSDNGTLGVGGTTSPGFIFDSTGTRTFNPANDYLTPGTPQEGFSVSYAGSGVLVNNNTGTRNIGSAASPVIVDSATSGYDNSVSWSGTVAGQFTIEHLYGLNDDSKQVEIKTKITALTDLTGVKFSRWIDPDSGGTSSINTRGNATLGLAPEDWVNSESETNGATLGLFSDSETTHNTAITFPWSTDPADYLAGSGDTVGDHSIGIGFDIGDLGTGDFIELLYIYAVAADIDDFELGCSFAPVAWTRNQLAVGTFLDENSSGAPPELQTILDGICPLSDEQVRLALDQFSGAIYGSLATANFQHTSYYLAQFANRLRHRMVIPGGLPDGGVLVGDNGPPDANKPWREEDLVVRGQCCDCSQRTAWLGGYGLGGRAETDGNADGFYYSLGGTQLAIEQEISMQWSLGAWANLAWSKIQGIRLSEQAEVENYHAGAYLFGMHDDCYTIALAGLGYDHFDVRRQIGVGPVNGTTEGQLDGWQANAYLERGVRRCFHGWDTLPYAALQYIYLRQDNLVESGAGMLNLAVGNLDAHSLRGVLGGRFSRELVFCDGSALTPELRAAWMHEFLDTNQVINAGLANLGASTFAVEGVDLGRDWATLGFGFSVQCTDALRMVAGYDLQFNDHQTFHIGSGGMEYVW